MRYLVKFNSVFVSLLVLLLVAPGCGDHTLLIQNESEPDEPQQDDQQQDDDPDDEQQQDEEPEQQQDSEAPTSSDFEEASQQTVRAQCEKMLECCSDDEIDLFLIGDVDDADDCVNAKSGMMGDGAQYLASAAAAGRIELNKSRIDTCVQALDRMSCDEFDATDEQLHEVLGCRGIIEPLVEEGEPCFDDRECLTGVCHAEPEDDEATCVEPPDQEGEECLGFTCGPELYCDSWTATCTVAQPEGVQCSDDEECLTGYCGDDEHADGTTTRTCQQRAEAVCTEE